MSDDYFDNYTDFESRTSLAIVAATIPGDEDHAFERISALYDIAEKLLSSPAYQKIEIIRSIPHILKIAVNIRDAVSDEELIERAIQLWVKAGDFRKARSIKSNHLHYLQLPRFILPSRYGEFPELHVCWHLINEAYQKAESLDLSKIRSFSSWLRIMMPARKNSDRLARFRRCIAEIGDENPCADINWIDDQFQKWKRHPLFDGACDQRNLLVEETARFLNWDEETRKKDLKKRASSGGLARWK